MSGGLCAPLPAGGPPKKLRKRIEALEAAITSFAVIELGDTPGHEFHGNQYTYAVQYSEDHEAMSKGEYKTATVKVVAPDETTASLHAAQLVGASTGTTKSQPDKWPVTRETGIVTSTKLISTRMEARLADHSGTGTVRPGDVIVDASKVGRTPGEFEHLHGATIHSSTQGLGAGITKYTDRNGYEKTAVVRNGSVTVERPA